MIRLASKADQPTVERIYLDCFPGYTLQSLRDHQYLSLTYVYDVDGQVLGYLMLGNWGYLTQIAVDKPYQRTGIGTKLIQFAEDNTDYYHIVLNTLYSNPARQWYERLGYETVTYDKHMYGRHNAGVRMIKELPVKAKSI